MSLNDTCVDPQHPRTGRDGKQCIRSIRERAKEKQRESGGAVPQTSAKPPIDTRAERRAGEILAEMEMQGPGEYQRSRDVTVAPKLSALRITKMQSADRGQGEGEAGIRGKNPWRHP